MMTIFRKADYDVKDEIGRKTMEWLNDIYGIRNNIEGDWYSLDPLQKICLYWVMGDICSDKEIRDFDCDSSEYVRDLFKYMSINMYAPLTAPYMDTMTSAWSPIKKFLDLHRGKYYGARMLLSDEGKEYAKKLKDACAMEFLEANHTIGNFISVPGYFNQCRSGYTGAPEYLAAYDQGYLMLQIIYNYYMSQNTDIANSLNGTKDVDELLPLFSRCGQNNIEKAIQNTKVWLDYFGSWDRFVVENVLGSMVERVECVDDDGSSIAQSKSSFYGPPIKYFEGHSLEKPYPDDLYEWRQWFRTATELIEMRSEDIMQTIRGNSINCPESTT